MTGADNLLPDRFPAVTADGETVEIILEVEHSVSQPTEYRLLEFLMERPGRVFSREQLLDGVWGSDIYIDERTVDVHVGRLRKAINRGNLTDPIRTVRGAGYSLDDRFGRAN
jgi:DNA-binding response OmpR family regulator